MRLRGIGDVKRGLVQHTCQYSFISPDLGGLTGEDCPPSTAAMQSAAVGVWAGRCRQCGGGQGQGDGSRFHVDPDSDRLLLTKPVTKAVRCHHVEYLPCLTALVFAVDFGGLLMSP